MKVAPATSSLRSSFSEMASSDGTKKSSQMIATPTRKKEFLPDICRELRQYTDEEGEDEEDVRDEEDVAKVGLLKVTSLPRHSSVAGVAGGLQRSSRVVALLSTVWNSSR